MSSIISALDKRKTEGNGGGADSILARNAAYREALRRGYAAGARDRMKLILTGVLLGLAFVALLVMTAVMMSSSPDSSRSAAYDTAEADARIPIDLAPTPEPVPTPTPPPAPTRPVMREKVQLRTQRLRHPSSDVPSTEADHAPVREVTLRTTPTPAPTAEPTAPPNSSYPPPAPKPTPDDPREFLVLTGMLDDVNNPTALINGQLVQIGESVQGAKLLEIHRPSTVVVEYQGKQYTLRLD